MALPVFSVSRAEVVDGTHVRVYFTCPVENSTSNCAPANFVFGGSFSLTPQSATAGGDYIDVEVNQMRANTPQTITVSNVRDALSRSLRNPKSASFTGQGGSPRIESVIGIDSRTIRVVFDEPMTNCPTLLNPANYIFTGPYDLSTLSVSHVNSRTVDIATTSTVPRFEYEISIVNVFDVLNNVIDPNLGKTHFTSSDRPKLLEAVALTNPLRLRLSFDREIRSTPAFLSWRNFTVTGPKHFTVLGAQFNGVYAVEIPYANAVAGGLYTVVVGTAVDTLNRELDPYYTTTTFLGVPGDTPLNVLSAEHVGGLNILVKFNQGVVANSALFDPSNYTIGGTTVQYITQRSPDEIYITVNNLVTNVTYRLYVYNLTSIFNTTLYIYSAYFTTDFLHVASARAMSTRKVDVWFDRDVKNEAALLNPTNYYFTGPTALISEQVIRLNSKAYRITTSELDMRQSGSYVAHVNYAKGAAGELLDPIYRTAAFSGFGVSPELDSAIGETESTIVLTFDEAMASATLTPTTNYTVVCTTEPWLMHAEAQDTNTIRMLFNKDVSDTAVTFSNYTFTCPTGLTLTASSAARVNGYTIDVDTIGAMRTGDANYTVLVQNVTDTDGNDVALSHRSVTFDGFGFDPEVVSATYLDSTHIDVLFDLPVEQVSAETEANYVIDGQSTPDIDAAVLDADTVTVHITTGTTFTAGNYTATVSGVTNLIGSPVDPANNSGAFIVAGLPSLPFQNHKTLTNGLLAYYPMDYNANDYFDNALNGSFPSGTPATITGKLINGYYLGPTWDNPELNTILLPSSALFDNLDYCSISAWVNIASFAAGNWHLIAGRYGQFACAIRDDGTLYLQAYNVAGIVQTYSTLAITAGSWYHIVAIWDGTYLKGFINNMQVVGEYITTGSTLVDSSGGNRWRMGCVQEPSGGAKHSALTGYLDEVGIWDRGLTKTEISNLYNSNAALSYDVVGPEVVSASFTDTTHLNVVFNEQLDSTTSETPGNYAITGASTPSVLTAVLDAGLLDVDLGLDAAMVSGAYTVTVSNVEDTVGNVVQAAYNHAHYSAVVGPFGGHASLGSDLVSYYKLEDANDSHTNNNHGGITGVLTPAVGKINNCYDFNTANNAWPTEYITVAPSASLNAMTQVSISCWLYPRLDAAGWWHQVIGRNNSYLLTVVDDPGGPMDHMIYMGIYTAGGLGQFVTNDPLIYADNWYHIVATFDGTNMKIYLNGIWQKTEPHGSPGNLACDVTKSVFFSGNSDGHSATNGLIDEIGIWNKALTQPEVTDLYAGGSGLGY